MDKKIIIFTGCTDGIGKSTLIELIKNEEDCNKFKFIVPVRNLEKGESLLAELKLINSNVDIKLMKLDLSSFESIKSFVDEFNKLNLPSLDILVNNAGVMPSNFEKTIDGFESTFGINHLGTSLLTILLLPNLSKSINGGNVILLSSDLHKDITSLNKNKEDGTISFECKESSNYSSIPEYSKSKLYNLIFSFELNKKLKEDQFSSEYSNIKINALHPGYTPSAILRDHNWFVKYIYLPYFFYRYGTNLQDMITGLIKLIKNDSNQTGKYFSLSNESKPSSLALDNDISTSLFNKTCELLSINNKTLKLNK